MNMRQGLQQRLPSILLTPNALAWSVFLTLLVHAAGAWGMLVVDRDLFVAFTPLNLALMFLLVLWNELIVMPSFNCFLQCFPWGGLPRLSGSTPGGYSENTSMAVYWGKGCGAYPF
jgi:hypothetical protein